MSTTDAPTTTPAAAAPATSTSPPGRILVHHLVTSRSERIIWLLEELGVPYDVQVHRRTKMGFAPESLKFGGRNPTGKAPAIELDGTVYVESGAILNLLLTRYAHPPASHIEPNPGSYSSVRWSHAAEGSLMLFLQPAYTVQRGADVFSSRGITGMVFGRAVRGFAAWYTGLCTENVARVLDEVEGFLAAQGGEAGFSGVEGAIGAGDIMMLFPLKALEGGRLEGVKLGSATQAWVDRMKKREGWVRASERIKKEEALDKAREEEAKPVEGQQALDEAAGAA